MSEYQRLVSYLHEYQNGDKGENVGYAKVEFRDRIGKMMIRIRMRHDVTAEGRVEFYRWNGNQVDCLSIGSIHISGGCCEDRILLTEEMNLKQKSGIRIFLPDCFIGSAWDDQPVPAVYGRREGEPVVYEQADRRGQDTEQSDTGPSETEQSDIEQSDIGQSDTGQSEENAGDLWAADTEQEQEGMSFEREEKVQAPENRQLERAIEARTPYREDADLSYLDGTTMLSQKRMDAAEQEEPPFAWLFSENTSDFMHMCPFEDRDIIDCVRVEPGDLEYLPQEYWMLGNNSFLMHGYYSYGHLILAKKQTQERTDYLIGVPGFRYNRDRFLAELFGFTAFLPLKKGEEFGYWYLTLPKTR